MFRHEQGLAKVETTMKHWRSPEIEAKENLQISLSLTQYIAGTGKPILEDTKTKLSYLDTVWYPDLRDFLAETDTTIEVDDPYIVPVNVTMTLYLRVCLRVNHCIFGRVSADSRYRAMYILTLTDILAS